MERNGLEGLTYCELARVALEAISEVRHQNAKSEILCISCRTALIACSWASVLAVG